MNCDIANPGLGFFFCKKEKKLAFAFTVCSAMDFCDCTAATTTGSDGNQQCSCDGSIAHAAGALGPSCGHTTSPIFNHPIAPSATAVDSVAGGCAGVVVHLNGQDGRNSNDGAPASKRRLFASASEFDDVDNGNVNESLSTVDNSVGNVVTVTILGTETTFQICPFNKSGKEVIKAINNCRDNVTRGDLYTLSNQNDGSSVDFLLAGNLTHVYMHIEPHPNIYRDWIAAAKGTDVNDRERVFGLWNSLPRDQRPVEGFFYWLQSCILLVDIDIQPTKCLYNECIEQRRLYFAAATELFRALLEYPPAEAKLLPDVKKKFGYVFLLEWATMNMEAVKALLPILTTREGEEGQEKIKWWHVDETTRRRLNDCISMPAMYFENVYRDVVLKPV